MGVMLDPKANPYPTEEEIARAYGLVPGSPEHARLTEMGKDLDEKGFLVTSAEDHVAVERPDKPSYCGTKSIPPLHAMYRWPRGWTSNNTPKSLGRQGLTQAQSSCHFFAFSSVLPTLS